MSYVLVKKGSYRNQEIKNKVYPLIKGLCHGANGKFVTVNSDGNKIRVKVAGRQDVEKVSETLYNRQQVNEQELVAEKPRVDDATRIKEIGERFEILDDMTKALVRGDIRSLIVTGPPGVGKSYGVEEQLNKGSLFGDMAGQKRRFEVVKGAMTALGLYAKLYQYSAKGDVVVFDDCDSVLLDDLSLNLLKAALDSGKKRMIYWNAESNKLRAEGIPDSFEFKGSACFITNIKFENVRSKKLQDHLEALMSRSHYLDLTLDTMRDKILRIKQIAQNGVLFSDYDFSEQSKQEILDFIEENCNKFREVSLRMALKVADLMKISANNWKALAQSTCMKRL
tara:strand:+ start:1808 stop:2821 length:1014 start_codon:yes stop_codon:yes gene_type:complete